MEHVTPTPFSDKRYPCCPEHCSYILNHGYQNENEDAKFDPRTLSIKNRYSRRPTPYPETVSPLLPAFETPPACTPLPPTPTPVPSPTSTLAPSPSPTSTSTSTLAMAPAPAPPSTQELYMARMASLPECIPDSAQPQPQSSSSTQPSYMRRPLPKGKKHTGSPLDGDSTNSFRISKKKSAKRKHLCKNPIPKDLKRNLQSVLDKSFAEYEDSLGYQGYGIHFSPWKELNDTEEANGSDTDPNIAREITIQIVIG